MTQRFVLPLQQVFTNLGIIGTGYKLKTYATGTVTPLATYSNNTLVTPNANPATGATTGNQIANSAGRFGEIWVGNPAQYAVTLTDPNDVVIYTADPMDGGTSSSSLTTFNPIPEAFWGTTGGTSTVYTLASNVDISQVGYQNTQIFELAFNVTCGNNPTLAIDGLSALNLKKYTGLGTKTALVSGDVTTQTYLARNDGTDIIILNPEHPANFPATTTTYRGLSYLPTVNPTIANNVSDANNDIDFSAGTVVVTSGNYQAVLTAKTKRADATWASGTGNGGMASGVTKSNNTTYHCFGLLNPSTGAVDNGFDTSLTAVNLLASAAVISAGFTEYYFIESFITDGSANNLGFKQNGKVMEFTAPVIDLTTSITNSRATYVLKTPLGRVVKAKFRYSVTTDGTETAVKFEPLYITDTATALTTNALFDFNLSSDANYADNGVTNYVITNTSSGIAGRSSAASTLTTRIVTLGWEAL